MSEREPFDGILASLHEAALDRRHWSSATALIDDALRTHGSSLVCGDGDGWSSAQPDSIRRLLPPIRQTVRVQHALDRR